MFEVGRLCLKIAGRDSDNYCVVVKKLEDGFVLIDGNVRRRKCNIKHLHPQKKKLDIKENASYKEVAAAMKKAGLKVVEKRGFKRAPKAEPQKKKQAASKEPQKKKPAKKVAAKKTSAKKK